MDEDLFTGINTYLMPILFSTYLVYTEFFALISRTMIIIFI